ncbi:YfbU family protein [Georgenia sp. M64]|uniref:YfbU family protein n=1 Tax=Georgenia sp. M64 TaxID=3120520 RepID=UPI0030DF281D
MGLSLSDLVRTTLENLLLRRDDASPGRTTEVAPRSLSPYERQMLALQHRILAHVMPADHADAPTEDCARVEGDPAYQRERAQILEGGYVSEYRDVFISTEPELPASESNFVMDLLDMFRVITFSIQRLRGAGTEVDEELERRLQFHGFDIQKPDEARLLDYVRHLVDEDRWPEILPLLGREHDYGNSHHPTRATYDRLLTEYNTIRDERGFSTRIDSCLLSFEELQRLGVAYVHPSNRTRETDKD